MESKAASRPYRMRKRAEHVNETRQRIVEATVRLHTTVGPANTTIAGIADEAGVTRVTVYRHFPDEEELYTACVGHWGMLHPPPDPQAWRAISGLVQRAEHALDELYRWYRGNGEDLFRFERDVGAMPPSQQEAMRASRETMTESLVVGSDVRGHARRRLRAVAGHVISYWTWRSLAIDQGLDHDDVVAVALGFVRSACSNGAGGS